MYCGFHSRDALIARAAKLEAETAGAARNKQTLELLTNLSLQASDLDEQIDKLDALVGKAAAALFDYTHW